MTGGTAVAGDVRAEYRDGGAAGAILAVDSLRHSFGAREVLQGLSFAVRRGEVFGLLGPNGSGKSTVLQVLCGLLPLQAGTISLDGVPLPGVTRRLRAQLGVVFQSPSLDLALTPRENLELAATLHAIPRSVASKRITTHLEAAGLADRALEPAGRLSGGMRRRLDLARALLHEPRLLLLDEPTAGLDEASFRNTWQHLEALREGRDLSVLVSTHRPDEAARCTRLAVLSEGRAAMVATPAELRRMVSPDVIVLRGEDPRAIGDAVSAHLGVAAVVAGGEVRIECERGHSLVPRIVEALGAGRLTSVSLQRPDLADVFLKITGRALDDAGHAIGLEEAA